MIPLLEREKSKQRRRGIPSPHTNVETTPEEDAEPG